MDKGLYLKYRQRAELGELDINLAFFFYKHNNGNASQELFPKYFKVWFSKIGSIRRTMVLEKIVKAMDNLFSINTLKDKEDKTIQAW